MTEEYPLVCKFCGKKFLTSEKKMFALEINEIVYTGNKDYPHKDLFMKTVQSCEDCLKSIIG